MGLQPLEYVIKPPPFRKTLRGPPSAGTASFKFSLVSKAIAIHPSHLLNSRLYVGPVNHRAPSRF
jgi:hypothetical protein